MEKAATYLMTHADHNKIEIGLAILQAGVPMFSGMKYTPAGSHLMHRPTIVVMVPRKKNKFEHETRQAKKRKIFC